MPTSADGTFIGYELAGDGPKIVLIDAAGHFRGNSQAAGLAELLAKEFTVVRYDRRGRGASSDTPPYAPEREVEDLAAVIDEVGGPVALYGYSSGCLIALHAAASGADISSLVLFEPPLELAPDDPAQREFTTQLQGLRGADAVEFFLAGIGVPEEAMAGMRDTAHWAAMVSVGHTLAYDSQLSEATDADLLRRVTVPTLLLDSEGSTDDLTGMAATAAALLPHAVHRSLPGEWHGVPASVSAPVIIAFLKETPPS